MATQVPITPIWKYRLRIYANTIRTRHIDRMETVMGYFTSPAARSVLGRMKAGAQIAMDVKICIVAIVCVSAVVSGDS